MKKITILLVINLLISSSLATGTECGLQLQDRDTSFMFVEVREDKDVGTLLASYPTLNVNEVLTDNETLSSKYIETRYNVASQKIEFYLTKPLIDYRAEKWLPSLEIEFNVSCQSDEEPSRSHTFLLLIEDENIYKPKFERGLEPFNVSLPWPTDMVINAKPIIIQDMDYNPKYSTCEIFCQGQDCDFFLIKSYLKDDVGGYNYGVNIYFNNNTFTFPVYSKINDIYEGHTFTITLVANDSMYRSESQVSFKALLEKGPESKFPIGPVAGGGSAIAALCLIFAVAFGYATVKNRKAQNILRKLTESEIREFLQGTASFGGATPKRSVDVNTPILSMPYNHAFEIPRDRLRIDETTVLGTGFFGIVMKGTVIRQNEDNLTVAVKAVKRNVGVLYFKALLSELKIMAFIGKNPNIVGLVGACTHNIRKREVYIAVEYCSNGNLHNFLQLNRTNFFNMVRDGKLCGLNAMENYAYRRRSSTFETISTLNLIKWCIQISNGMEYLSSLGVIHGDLATRNILLDSVKVAKIADFGLSRRLIDYNSNDYYTKNSQGPLPWKWMAPESLKDMKFSKKSDVWSYGIVLYEIFTLGQTPYPGLSWDETFVDRLEKGLRMGQPPYASNEIYEIMTDCWTENPNDRPNVFDIKRSLEGMASSLLIQKDEGYFRVVGGVEKYIDIGPQSDEYLEGSTSVTFPEEFC